MGATIIGLIGGLVFGHHVHKKMVALAAPAYALFEGLFLGAIAFGSKPFSLVSEYRLQVTFGVLWILSAYRSGMIKATEISNWVLWLQRLAS